VGAVGAPRPPHARPPPPNKLPTPLGGGAVRGADADDDWDDEWDDDDDSTMGEGGTNQVRGGQLVLFIIAHLYFAFIF